MCAIAGIYSPSVDYSCVMERMLHSMLFRGPDATYQICEQHFYAGMNRLSINDVEHGVQPFRNADASIIVLFNGEIYNHALLREELQRDGIQFHTHCDGEVLPSLYEKYGEACFEKLSGMFAIAIYDLQKARIILARDVSGEKPLYYMSKNHEFAFCSLISPFKHYTPLSLNPHAIWDFFTFGFIPEPQCIYQDIKALEAGSYLVFDSVNAKIETFDFKQALLEKYVFDDSKNLSDIAREIVRTSVLERLLSDVSVGAFLSGGIDSSIVSTVAQQEIGDLNTFNISFVDGYDPYCGFVNEGEFAKLMARHIHTTHHEIQVSAKEYQADLMGFIKSIDQPYGAISGIGIKMIARYAREMGIKVLLSGDGADEWFGGYSWYPKLQFDNPQYITAEKPKGWHYYAFESEKRSFLSEEFFAHSPQSTRFFPEAPTPLACIDFDRAFYLPFEMMSKVDRMCMSESVEGRACFVSPQIMAFCSRLDYATLLQKGEKWILKEAFQDILPQEILTRSKHGFNAPIDYWMKHDWFVLLEQVFCEESMLRQQGVLNHESKERFMKHFHAHDRRFGSIAFYLVVLEWWLREEGCR